MSKSVMSKTGQIHNQRICRLNDQPTRAGAVIYWMHRDQRADDNFALLYARQLAQKNQSPLYVAFCLVEDFAGANWRMYKFMLDGLKELEKSLKGLKFPFFLLRGSPERQIPALARRVKAAAVVSDFSPLRTKQQWDQSLADSLNCELIEVDAHNIIPPAAVSGSQQYAARTIRPRIHRQLDEFLVEILPLSPGDAKIPVDVPKTNWDGIYRSLSVKLRDDAAEPISWLRPGQRAARQMLDDFIAQRLDIYADKRNDPNIAALSNLSPYMHFGQIAPQRVALAVQNASEANTQAKEAFLEELIVRRELSDNFCLYNSNYDNFDGLPQWAQKTLDEHSGDKREYIYTPEQFAAAQTHDAAWNAAQNQMVQFGKMHGYMRMYWAKKILEWSPDAATAIKTAIALNDRYSLDGRDPNGYVGVLWAIGGLHDRPWKTREIFGSIRYMVESGLRRKFKLDSYINAVQAGENILI